MKVGKDAEITRMKCRPRVQEDEETLKNGRAFRIEKGRRKRDRHYRSGWIERGFIASSMTIFFSINGYSIVRISFYLAFHSVIPRSLELDGRSQFMS